MKRKLRHRLPAFLAAAFVLGALFSGASAGAATFVVASAGDGSDSDPGDGVCSSAGRGGCTLRAAIEEANARSGLDRIEFALPGSGVRTLSPGASLPYITDELLIDGWSQGGGDYQGPPLVVLSGAAAEDADSSDYGLYVRGAAATVRGLALSGWDIGIWLQYGGGSAVQGCFIGTDASGTASDATTANFNGVAIDHSSDNVVGGERPEHRNVISGNAHGLVIQGEEASGNSIFGNRIGTSADGSAAIPNDLGVIISDAPGNAIGSGRPEGRNLISGNYSSGVSIFGRAAVGNAIFGNFIGTDARGADALGNGEAGIQLLEGPSRTRIGSGRAGEGNLISGNDWGIFLYRADENAISGNTIGTDVDGAAAVGNGTAGVWIENSRRNRVGGLQPGEGNLIRFNGLSSASGCCGVGVSDGDTDSGDPSATGNSIRGNSIHGNRAEVWLWTSETSTQFWTPNDRLDADTGPNNLQNYPEIDSAVSAGGATVVAGRLHSLPGKRFEIDLYASAACHESGHGGGARYLQSSAVATNDDGNAAFAVDLVDSIAVGEFVTATAVNLETLETSEFSVCVEVTEDAAGGGRIFVVDSAGDDPDQNIGNGVCRTEAGDCTLRAAIEEANFWPGRDLIRFRIPGGGMLKTLRPAAVLPEVDDEVIVDAWTQGGEGYGGPPLIEIEGAGSGVGLDVRSAGPTILRGLVIHGFDAGIRLAGGGKHLIRGCYVGTDASGTEARGNGVGILVTSPENAIGGPGSGQRVLVSGNRLAGIRLEGEAARGNSIVGCSIGTDLGGGAEIGNGDGIHLLAGASDTVIRGNTIAFNDTGVRVVGAGSFGNSIRENSIFSNLGLGIDLGDAGPNANDEGDADLGPNQLQNAPVLIAVTALENGGVSIAGLLSGEPATEHLIDFYASLPGDGDASGRLHLGTAAVVSDSGAAAFSVTLPLDGPEAVRITAVATRSIAPFDSSEFSPPVEPAPAAAPARQVPGDCNQDGRLDISDASCVLGFLFLGVPSRLPCGDGSSADPANVALIDWQPDGRPDLSDAVALLAFLFSGGAPHPAAVSGSETRGCVEIPGCPDNASCSGE
jgi:CSLREA domain-containing protein